LSETRKYRKFTPQQKLELVMASWRGERSIAELCREHDISESLLRRWREQVLEAGMERFAAGEQRSQGAEQRRRIAELERALGRKTYELPRHRQRRAGRTSLGGPVPAVSLRGPLLARRPYPRCRRSRRKPAAADR
jgi:transposase